MDKSVLKFFASTDSILYGVMCSHGSHIVQLQKKDSHHYMAELCESIVSQQLSEKAARTIWLRTHEFINDWNDPQEILASSDEVFRQCGFSRQKISYVKNIAQASLDGKLHTKSFDQMTDEDIITELVAIKGVGRWTAEMFLIFTLGRPDVFSGGDLGLRNAIMRLYDTKNLTPLEASEIAKKWSPYRSYAARALWLSLDNQPLLT